jgi:hypothetical protein
MKPRRVIAAAGALAASVVLGAGLVAPASAAPALPVLVSDNPADYTPKVTGGECYTGTDPALCRRVLDMTRIGNTVYAGGVIDTVKNAYGTYAGTYGNAIAFDAVTGAVKTDFKPMFVGASGQITDGQVNAVERSTGGTALWFGGEFKKLNGAGARGLVRWDVASNSVYSTFQPKIGADAGSARVYDVKYFCGRLWVAGDFTSAGGVARTALVSLDPTTGAATSEVNLGITGTASSTAGPTRVTRIAPSPNCQRVVIIGNFTRVAGQERYQVAVLNVSSAGVASLAPWYSPYHLRASQPGVGADPCSANTVPVWGRDVDWAPDGTWWALVSTGGPHRYPALCDSVSRWTNNDSTDARPVWINYSSGDTFLSVRVTGSHVYVGGHFRYLDQAVYRGGTKVYGGPAHAHYGLGVINATLTSGMAVPGWNDGSSTGRGHGWTAMLVVPGGAGTGSGLWVGGDADVIKGEAGKRVALLPLYP